MSWRSPSEKENATPTGAVQSRLRGKGDFAGTALASSGFRGLIHSRLERSMTDPYAGSPPVEDITDEADSPTARLDRQADAILRDADAREAGVRPLRQAVREDASLVRDWGRQRASIARDAVQAEPVKATLYALGLGVVIGLLIAR
jgi:ElaB/YqjD/DUF883 family membrane-anchored ribosome-binding protein